MNIKIIKFNNNEFFPQTISCESIVVNSFSEINRIEADFILIMEQGWDFSRIDSLEYLLKEISLNGYAFGFYSDVRIDGIYKNNLPFNIETLRYEKIISPLLLKKNIPIDFNQFNSVIDIIKTVGQKFLLFRSPQILFVRNG